MQKQLLSSVATIPWLLPCHQRTINLILSDLHFPEFVFSQGFQPFFTSLEERAEKGFCSNENTWLPNMSEKLMQPILSPPLLTPAVAPQCRENKSSHPPHGQQSLRSLTPASLPVLVLPQPALTL